MVELIKVAHHLTFKFETMYLDWVAREKNAIADKFARYASQPRLTSESKDLFRIFFNLA